MPHSSQHQDTPPEVPPAATPANIALLLEEVTPPIWYRRPRLWGGLSLGLVLVVSVIWGWQAHRIANAALSYTTETVVRGDLTLVVTANGTLQPLRSINIGSELSGTVLKVLVDVNDHVKAGQVLVELDTAKLSNQVLRSKATLDAAIAKVAQMAATVKEARIGLERLERVAHLSDGKIPSKADLDTGRAILERALADTASAKAGVSDAQAALSTDMINQSKASIRAPTEGVVLVRNVDPGNAVAATLQAVTLLTVADDLAQLRLQVYVDEADVGSVQLGQESVFTVSAYPRRKYPARITRVAFGSTITDNVVTYLTYLDVDNSDLSLRPGMTATAMITATQRKDVLLVPNSALRFTPTLAGAAKPNNKNSLVASMVPRMPRSSTRRSAATGASTSDARQAWVLRDGVPASVAVVPGISDGRMTEMIGGDLQEGMQVITGQKSLADQ